MRGQNGEGQGLAQLDFRPRHGAVDIDVAAADFPGIGRLQVAMDDAARMRSRQSHELAFGTLGGRRSARRDRA